MIWLGMDLGFQNTDKEFAVFNRMYGEASGAYIYALINGDVAGGVGFRKLSNDICEMKRLYVYEDYRGCGLLTGFVKIFYLFLSLCHIVK